MSSSGYTGSSDLYIRYYIFHYYNSASINQVQLWRGTGDKSFTLTGTVVAPAPPPPTGGTATPNSSTQITWGWTKPGSGYSYRGYDASSGGNLQWTSATDASSYQEGSLTGNTAYTRYVATYDGYQDSSTRLAIGPSYTLQVAPATPTFGAITLNSIVLNTSGPLNITTGTSGCYFDETTNTGDGGINEWVQALTDTSTGLSTNTQYTYRVKARNAVSAETAYSATASRYTMIEAATGITFGTITTTSIQAKPAGTFTNLTAGSSAVRTRNDTIGAGSGWVQNQDFYTSSGLSVNTPYDFEVESRNGDAVATGEIHAIKYTLQAAATTPTVTADSTSQLTVATTGPVNLTLGSSGVIFKRDGTTDLAKVQALSRADTGLGTNTAHTYTARGVNGDGVETAQSSASAAKYTLQATPTAPTFSNITTTGFRVTTTGPVNLTSGSSGVIFHNGTADRPKVTTLYDDVSGLTANTQYTFKAKGVNGDGVVTAYSGTASHWTLSIPPTSGSVTPDKSSPCSGDSITWTAVGGFGAGKVQYYRYVWDQSATHSWTDTETQWSSGTIQTSPTSGGTWYLHVKGYNGANVGNGTYDYAINTGTTPAVPTNCQANPSHLCLGGSSTLSATPGGESDIVEWFTGSCGGTPVPGGSSPTVSPATTTTYYTRARNTSSGCVSGDCCQVTVVVCACVPVDFDHDCDVDKTDFIHFVSCASAPGVPQDDPNCADAKLDGDDDVDQDDFAIFQRCYSGKNHPPDPNCMN